MIEKNKETQTQSLAELQQELKSLKTLLLNRGSASPPMPVIGRPAIPAWQLASSGHSNGVEGSSNTSFRIPVVSVEKGKEAEVADDSN